MSDKLKALRDEMKKQGVDGFYVPMADQFQNEYVPACFERLKWLTGFRGSAGMAVVTTDKAAFFSDSRYTIQARDEVNAEDFEIYSVSADQGKTPTLLPEDWIRMSIPRGGKFGIDPLVHTVAGAQKIEFSIKKAEAELVLLEDNLIDNVWEDQPPMPLEKAFALPLQFAGKPSKDKVANVANVLKKSNVSALLVTMPEDICWLLNVRGNDIPYNPLVLSYALVRQSGEVVWFVDKRKITPEVERWIFGVATIQPFEGFASSLLAFEGRTVWLDPTSAAVEFKQLVESGGGKVYEQPDPIALMKAKKNPVEVQGMIKSHVRDGVSLTRFLAVLDDKAEVAKLTEMSAADKLEDFRKGNEHFKGLSFRTISGAAGNGAVVHYTVNKESDIPLVNGPIYLVDSGAQYLDGTTDVTRTVAVGDVTDEMKDRYTRVLKGHIQVAMSTFVEGEEKGAGLDEKARAPLAEVGLGYAHGTGHGVGSFLCVHEGPCGIVPKKFAKVPFVEGMVVSNEPGYYQEGEYGIRIESLIVVQDTGIKNDEGKKVLGFKTLTMAPIDLSLVDKSLLTEDELAWLNAYHAEVRETLTPLLSGKDSKALEFLERSTKPL